jgi:hypothetical protein
MLDILFHIMGGEREKGKGKQSQRLGSTEKTVQAYHFRKPPLWCEKKNSRGSDETDT